MPAQATIRSPQHQSGSAIARILALLALVACAVALIVVISGGLAGDDGEDGGDGRERPRADQPRREPKPQSDTYTVVPGDTLSGIAAKSGISLRRLERLNPDLDPATLNAGQQIKLR